MQYYSSMYPELGIMDISSHKLAHENITDCLPCSGGCHARIFMFQSQNKVIRGENSQSSVLLSFNILHMRHGDIKRNVFTISI